MAFGIGEDGGGDELVETTNAETVEHRVLTDKRGDAIPAHYELQEFITPTV